MIDLEEEYRAFENTWILLGASFKNFKRGGDNMYHFVGDTTNLTDSEKTLTLSCINTALAMWLIQARAKDERVNRLQSENAELKAKLEKYESGEFVVVPKILTNEIVGYIVTNVFDDCIEDVGVLHEIHQATIEAARGGNENS